MRWRSATPRPTSPKLRRALNRLARVPLPAGREALLASAVLGARVAGLLGADDHAEDRVDARLRGIGAVRRRDGGMLDPDRRGDLAGAAGWGYAGVRGVAMPGTGSVNAREYSPEELRTLEEAARSVGLGTSKAAEPLGARPSTST
jgi:hypothetical protein